LNTTDIPNDDQTYEVFIPNSSITLEPSIPTTVKKKTKILNSTDIPLDDTDEGSIPMSTITLEPPISTYSKRKLRTRNSLSLEKENMVEDTSTFPKKEHPT